MCGPHPNFRAQRRESVPTHASVRELACEHPGSSFQLPHADKSSIICIALPLGPAFHFHAVHIAKHPGSLIACRPFQLCKERVLKATSVAALALRSRQCHAGDIPRASQRPVRSSRILWLSTQRYGAREAVAGSRAHTRTTSWPTETEPKHQAFALAVLV